MAFPTYGDAAVTNGAGNGGTAVSLAAPSGVAAGDYQLAIVAVVSSTPTFSAAPAGWTKIVDITVTDPDGSSTGRLGVFESTTATGAFTNTLSSSRVWQGIRAYWRLPSGSTGRTIAPATLVQPSAQTSHVLPSVTTTAADSLIVCIGSSETQNTAQSWTSTGAATSRQVYNALNAIERLWMVLADRERATAGAGSPATFTTSVADMAFLVSIVINGVGSTPPVEKSATDSGTGTDSATVAVVTPKAATDSAAGSDTISVVDIPAPPTPGTLFDLSRWHLTLPTEDPGPDTDAAQINQPELATYTDQNYYTENGMIVCRAPVQGATTSGASGATRSEHREHEANYANSAWDPLTTGRRQLTITTHVDASNITGGTTPRKESIIYQIHGAGDSPIPLVVAAEYHVATPRIRVFLNGPGFDNPVLGITPTTPITIRCRVENARVKLWVINGQVADLPATPTYDWPASGTFTDLEGWYFKWGTYNKTTITSGSTGESYARISYYELLQPGDPDPVTPPRRLFLPF